MTIYDNREIFFSAYKLFHKKLKTSFHNFMDRELTVAFARPIIDPYKFDDWLHEKFGNYEDEGLSMNDVLTNNFGERVALKIKGLLA